MEIEYKNVGYADKNIYQVGNVIMHIGYPCLVTEMEFKDEQTKYFLVSLVDGDLDTGMRNSLEELERDFGSDNDRLVKAKLIVDYNLDGDTEDEDTK